MRALFRIANYADCRPKAIAVQILVRADYTAKINALFFAANRHSLASALENKILGCCHSAIDNPLSWRVIIMSRDMFSLAALMKLC